jgi:hypothetical protein
LVKNTGFIWISKGFLEDDIVWVGCGHFDLKNQASILAFNIADDTMTNIHFFESLFCLYNLPESNPHYNPHHL